MAVAEELERSRLMPLLPALAAFAAVFGLAAAQGGYFPTSWGWACVPLLWTVAVVVIVGKHVVLSTVERTFLLLLAGLTGWIALSAASSVAGALTVLELARA